MANKSTLDERLTKLELVVAKLQHRVENGVAQGNWLNSVIGSVSDDSAFLEALEYGRAFRAADRPTDELTEQP